MISAKLARREIKNNLKYWVFFALNLIIGLLGFTFILIFKNTVGESLEIRSKTLLSADVAITGRRALEGKERSLVDDYLKSQIGEQTTLKELYSMGRVSIPEKRSRLIFIKAIAGKFPLIGKIDLQENGALTKEQIEKLQIEPSIIISKEVSHQFKINIGDSISLGTKEFKVFDILEFDSTSSMRGVSLAPKAYIGSAFLEDTGLLGFGSVSWSTDFYKFKASQDFEKIKSDLESIITDPAIKVRTPKNSSEQLSRIINYLTDYLGLIGVVALLISSVGSAYLFQSYVLDRLKQIGILKSLGLSHIHIAMVFINIILFFGFMSSVAAFGLSKLILPLAISYLNQWLVGEFQMSLSLETFLIIFCIGVVINLLVCLPVLQKILKSKTVNLLSNSFESRSGLKDSLLFIPAVLGLWGLSVWQAHSFIIGTVFTFAMLLVFAVVLLILPYFFKAISNNLIGKPMNFPFNLDFGIALRILSRNRLSTIMTILSLSIGITLITVISQIDSSLKSELTDSKDPKPSLFMFDIQDEQMDALVSYAKEKKIPLQLPTPMIRARLLKKNGEEVKRIAKEEGFQTR
jgi:putative ABC transport system permease protein